MYAPKQRTPRLGLMVTAPVVGNVGISFTTPSEKRAANVIGPVVASANNGNLNAVAILDSRRSLGIVDERAVWAKGFNQVLPAIRAVYDPQRNALVASIPASAQKSPEAAASWALNTTVTQKPTTIQTIADTVVPVLLGTDAGQELQQAVVGAAVKDKTQQLVSTAKSWMIPLGLALGFVFLRGGTSSNRRRS